jgi:hypothetical protein
MKRILKPDLWKIILTITLLVISSLLWRAYVISHISDTFPMGFPFQFYLAWGPCQPGKSCSKSNLLFFVFDAIIWYLVSAFIMDLMRKKTG